MYAKSASVSELSGIAAPVVGSTPGDAKHTAYPSTVGMLTVRVKSAERATLQSGDAAWQLGPLVAAPAQPCADGRTKRT